jgi:hypothetical protein
MIVPYPLSNQMDKVELRDCPKSTGSARKVASQVAEATPFGPFWPRYPDQINARSVARTPFRTVSPRTSVNKRKSHHLATALERPRS